MDGCRTCARHRATAGRDAAHIEASTIAAPTGWFHVTDSDRIVTPSSVEKIGIT